MAVENAYKKKKLKMIVRRSSKSLQRARSVIAQSSLPVFWITDSAVKYVSVVHMFMSELFN